MRTKYFICCSALIAFAAFWAACGGSSSSTEESAGGVTGGTDDTTDAVNLNSVDAVSADLSALDLSQSAASANVAVGQAAKAISKVVDRRMGSAVGNESMAGCQLSSMKDEALRIGKQARIFQCYLGKMQDNFTEFVIPDGSYAYYSLTMPAMDEIGESESKAMKIRVGKNVVAANTLSAQICKGDTQNESFILSSDAATRAITIDMKHHFSFTPPAAMDVSKQEGFDRVDDGDGEITDGERGDARELGIIDEWGQMTGTVVADAAATGNIDDITEVDSAAIDARFSGMWGEGNMTFEYDEDGSPTAGAFNKVEGRHKGSFGDTNQFEGGLLGMFDTTQGSAKYGFTGSFPAMAGSMFGSTPPPFVSASKHYCPISGCNWESTWAELACQQPQTRTIACVCMEESASGGTSAVCPFTNSGTEHFTVAADDDDTDTKPEFYIAATSIYQALVDATLPSALSTVTKEFTGNQAWDCSGTLTAIDISAKASTGAFDECTALEDEAFDRSSGKEGCMEQKQGDDRSQTQGELQ